MEHRVTLMVTLIVTTFIILNGPSAVIHLVNLARKKKLNYNFTLLGNTLVIIDKACNFILFCLTSRHFRARLFQLTQRKVNRFSASFLQISDSMRRIGSTLQGKSYSINDDSLQLKQSVKFVQRNYNSNN
ncbi:unnamed protein product [Wuchereria bancrofti]|uniref:G-protein coupled receptors family 1 profile domain-containing protein n=1 Tax=Wuchereria bancrofti TaxID=6293 RepID=A0A3P7DNE4_WUCBA|nr:unnamed protein product [Wuchereria bancrofti]